jgi:glyoxylase-like metal-dependent hydrolase (beta-lactamase superfamily II)
VPTVEEGKTFREVSNGGWDNRVRVFECDKMVRAFLIRSQRLTVVIDTLLGPQAGSLLLEAAREHVCVAAPLVVINSHADWDHYWGNQVFPAPIVGSALSVHRVLVTHGPLELAKKRKDDERSFADVIPTPPSILIDGPGSLHGGDLTFHLLPTPGHRPDHLAVWVPELMTLFAGDAVEDPFPLLDDSEEMGPANHELVSLETLMDLHPAWLMPCHAEPQIGDSLIRANLDYVTRLLDTARRSESSEDLLRFFPYPGPAGDDFYQSEHLRNLEQALREVRQPVVPALI